MIVATQQIFGKSAYRNGALKILRSSRRKIGPRSFRQVGGILSGPVASLHLANISSSKVNLEHLSWSVEGESICFLNSLMRLHSLAVILTLA